MLTVSELFIYPIKSLGGISVASAMITDRGFQYDRRWMLVDENNHFLTQREFAAMALLQVELTSGGLKVYHKKNIHSPIIIPAFTETNEKANVEIFGESCSAQFVSRIADEWFSEMLLLKCRLVYMPDSTKRSVDNRYAFNKEITSWSDAFALLIIGQSSLNDLNSRLAEPLPINRFRPNIVFTGGAPYEEDVMKHFTINGINFYGAKLSARCVITTINQENAGKAKEPLKTLAAYRMKNNKIYFGQNLLHNGAGTISLGDTMKIIKVNASEAFNISKKTY
jgi:uncharacterized protein YcbX